MFIPEQVAIQATQYIIDLLENSKLQSEEALDSLPSIFAVINKEGQILKGNKSLAHIFGINYEYLLGKDFKQIFSEENWQVFNEKISEIKTKTTEKLDFKLNLKQKDGSSRNYFWNISPLYSDWPNFPTLYSILGHDVTDLTRATKENARMQYELTTAKIVQNAFFPSPKATFGKSSIASYIDTATECGGDWWYHRVIKDKLYLWIGDVTGHGVSAALVVSAVHSVVSIVGDQELNPAKTLEILNRTVASMTDDPLVMTFLAATIDLKTGECIYSSAGHEPIIVLPHDKDKIVFRDLKLLQGDPSVSLGMTKSPKFEESKIQLQPGDRLVFYTDGMYDIASPTAHWNRSTFHRTLAKLVTLPQSPDDLVSTLKRNIDEYRQGTPLKDDVTFFIFQL
jgi:PAS domain S-box-containing protein